MPPLAEYLYVMSLVSVNLTIGALMYFLGSLVFAGVLFALGLVVAVGGVASRCVEPRQTTSELPVD